MQERISSLSMVHTLKIRDNGEDGSDIEFIVPKFSSTQFERLFFLSNMPSSATKKDFDYTKKYRKYRKVLDYIMGKYKFDIFYYSKLSFMKS